MKIFGIDPGTNESAYILWDTVDEKIERMDILPNNTLLSTMRAIQTHSYFEHGYGYLNPPDVYVIEGIFSYGMPVGASTFETCYMIGRMLEIVGTAEIVARKDIKLHLCGTTRAKDANIRQALIDHYGKPGVKKAPGKLYGVKTHLWSACAVCIFWQDTYAV